MIHRIGANGIERIDVSANSPKNNLPIGTVLHLNGYNDPDYVIVKNTGIDQKYGHGARYQTVSLEDGSFSFHDAYSMMYLREKESNRIQMYITDEIKSPEECLALYEKAGALKEIEMTRKEAATKNKEALIARGREVATGLGIESSVALIVAEYENNESDSQTDYFATSTSQLVVLATSPHSRDLFKEMRKAANRCEKTAHLGTGKGIFLCSVAIKEDFHSNGSWYSKGSRSCWHKESERVFTTRAEAEAYIKVQSTPEPIVFEGTLVNFSWEMREESIEHREKYSMGAGYYLKASTRYSSGWKVRKIQKWGENWSDEVYISLAQIHFIKGDSNK